MSEMRGSPEYGPADNIRDTAWRIWRMAGERVGGYSWRGTVAYEEFESTEQGPRLYRCELSSISIVNKAAVQEVIMLERTIGTEREAYILMDEDDVRYVRSGKKAGATAAGLAMYAGDESVMAEMERGMTWLENIMETHPEWLTTRPEVHLDKLTRSIGMSGITAAMRSTHAG